jgi:hypothetical protein
MTKRSLHFRAGSSLSRALRIFVSCTLLGFVFWPLAIVAAHGEPKAKQSIVGDTPADAIETSVSDIVSNPLDFNNKLVKFRGLAAVSSELSMIEGYGTSDAIWLTYAGSAESPGPTATILGSAVPGGIGSATAGAPLIPVRLIKDSNFRRFEGLLNAAAKTERSDSGPTYGVVATFVGRLDSVSADVHAAHLKQNPVEHPDGKGFGFMGTFDTELVVESVEGPFELYPDHYRPSGSK